MLGGHGSELAGGGSVDCAGIINSDHYSFDGGSQVENAVAAGVVTVDLVMVETVLEVVDLPFMVISLQALEPCLLWWWRLVLCQTLRPR